MDVREELAYDAAPDDVFEMLCDKGFREQVCEAIGSLRYDVSVSRDDDTASVRVDRVMPANVPAAARRVVGDTIEMVQTERWGQRQADGSRRAEFRVEIPGKPGSITGTVTLTPAAGGGAREVVDGQVTVSIPLVGGKLEAEVARGLRAALATENRVGASWLTRRG